MAVKWIGDVARELGMDVLDAVELLASKQNYPMNGLLDEDRVQFLKLYRGERRGAEVAAQLIRDSPPEPEEAQEAEEAEASAEQPTAEKKSPDGGEAEAKRASLVTAQHSDRAEDKTVIINTIPSA